MQTAFTGRNSRAFARARVRECFWHAVTLPFSRLSNPQIASELSEVKFKLLQLTVGTHSEADVENTLNGLIDEMNEKFSTSPIASRLELILAHRDRYFAPYFAKIPHYGQRATSRVEAENYLTKHHQLTSGKVNAGRMVRCPVMCVDVSSIAASCR